MIDKDNCPGKLQISQQQQRLGVQLAKQKQSGSVLLADRMGVGMAVQAAEKEARKKRQILGQLVIERNLVKAQLERLQRKIAAAESALRGAPAPAAPANHRRRGDRLVQNAVAKRTRTS